MILSGHRRTPPRKRDRLTEQHVPLYPLATFADRLRAAIADVPAHRDPHVFAVGLHGAVVVGWSAGEPDRRLDKHQLAPIARVIHACGRRVTQSCVEPASITLLIQPLIAAMTAVELQLTYFATSEEDPADGSVAGTCRRLVADALRARRS